MTTEKAQQMWLETRLLHSERNENIRLWRKQAYAERYEREPAWEGGSRLQIPMTAWVLETLHDRLFLSQFFVSPTIRIKPVEIADTALATAIERVLDFYHKKTKKREAVSMASYDALLLGCGVVRVVWKKATRKWGRKRVEGYPFTEYVPLENFYLRNPYAPVEDNDAVFHVYYRRKGEMMNDNRFDPDVVSELKGVLEEEFQLPEEHKVKPTVWTDGTIQLVDIFYRDEETDGWRIATYAPAPNNAVLSDTPFVFPEDRPPFFMLRFFHSAYGRGLGSLLFPLEEELSVLHNQRIDNNTLINMPVVKVLSTSPALRDNEVWFAGKKIVVDTQEDIQPMQLVEKVTPLQDEQQIFEYIKLFSGISEILSGNPLRGEKTAYEVEATLMEGSVRFRKFILHIVEWLKEQSQLELLLLKHYGNDREIYTVSLYPINPFNELSDDDILYRFTIEGNTTLTNKEMERQKWLLLRNMLAQEPSIVQNPQAWYEVLRQLLTAYDVDYKAIIGEPPTAQPLPSVPQTPDVGQLGALAQQIAQGGVGFPPELLGGLIPSLGGAVSETAPQQP